MLLKLKVSSANLQPQLSNNLIPKLQGKFKGLNWTMEAVGSISAKEAAVTEGMVTAATVSSLNLKEFEKYYLLARTPFAGYDDVELGQSS